jgi:hypothetical protein
MSVANILDVTVPEQIDPVWVPFGGGGGGNLATVLATGPNPGSAGCQPMIDVFGIGGCPTVDLQITSVGPNADLILENNNASDGVIVNAGTSIQLNTDQFASGANTIVQISAGQTDIQPNPTYPYGNNPDVPLKISNYNNPTGFVQGGVSVGPNSAQGEIQGFTVDSLTAGPGADGFGMKIDTITADNIACGIRTANITANVGTAIGHDITGVNGVDAIGVFLGGLNANSSNTTGLEIKTPVAAQDCRAINVGNVQGTNVWGAEFNTLTASSGDARGVVVSGADGSSSAGVGVEINSTTGGPNGAYAVLINGTTSVAGGSAFGIEVGNTNGDLDARGINASAINSTNGRAEGVITTSITASAVGADANGFRVDGVTSLGGFSRGMYINNVAATVSRAFGVDMTNVVGGGSAVGFNANLITTSGASTAAGMNINNVAATTGTGVGVSLNTISGIRAVGIDLANVVATNTTPIGIRVQSVRSTSVPAFPAYGGFFQRGTKLATDAGQLMRIFDGNLGLALQVIDGTLPQDVLGDGGNLVVITPAAAGNINLVMPSGGWEPGQWFLFSKQGGGAHTLTDSAGNNFNSTAAPFNIGGPAGSMCLIFWTGVSLPFPLLPIGWAAHAF